MFESKTSLIPLLERLVARVNLSDDDRKAVLALPRSERSLHPHELFLVQGEKPTHCGLMVEGFTVREKIVVNGARQILAVHMKGEMVDLQNVLLDVSDHSVRALTPAKMVVIPRAALEELTLQRPSIGKALWMETLVDGSVFREWIANVGRRDARTRIAHVLCEFAIRIEAAGLASATDYEFPMSQDQLADTVGLTPVHVNRTLRHLTDEGLIEREKRSVRIKDWQKLAKAGDFNPQYLHLPVAPGEQIN